MLADYSPPEWVEIRAAKRAVPLPDSWREAGTVAAVVHNEFEIYRTARSGRRFVDPTRIHEPEVYIPQLAVMRPGDVPVNEASIAAHQRAIEERYGDHR